MIAVSVWRIQYRPQPANLVPVLSTGSIFFRIERIEVDGGQHQRRETPLQHEGVEGFTNIRKHDQRAGGVEGFIQFLLGETFDHKQCGLVDLDQEGENTVVFAVTDMDSTTS